MVKRKAKTNRMTVQARAEIRRSEEAARTSRFEHAHEIEESARSADAHAMQAADAHAAQMTAHGRQKMTKKWKTVDEGDTRKRVECGAFAARMAEAANWTEVDDARAAEERGEFDARAAEARAPRPKRKPLTAHELRRQREHETRPLTALERAAGYTRVVQLMPRGPGEAHVLRIHTDPVGVVITTDDHGRIELSADMAIRLLAELKVYADEYA